MPNIKPVSELRNYGNVLKEVSSDAPVLLTKNGYGAYAVLDIADYNEYMKLKALDQLLTKVDLAVKRGDEEGWVKTENVMEYLKDKYDI